MEKRKFERVEIRTEAMVRYGDTSFRGEVENLSLKGLFVRTDRRIPLHEKVDVTMYFHGTSSELSVSLEAAVVRVTDEGIGLHFRKIDIDSLLRSEGSENPLDPARREVIEELYGFVEEKEEAVKKVAGSAP